MRRFARAIAPENPRANLIILSTVLSLFAALAFVDIYTGRMVTSAVGNLDYSLFNLFAELRSATADELLIRITMFGDENVLFGAAAAGILWLMLMRNWRAAVVTAITIFATKLIILAFTMTMGPHDPIFVVTHTPDQHFEFPSAHALLAGVVLGCFTVLSSRSLSRWTQALIAASCGVITIAISFSRLYLGVNWLSDIIAALMLAAIIVTIYSVMIETYAPRRMRPIGLLASGLIGLVLFGSLQISSSYEQNEVAYAERDRTQTATQADWLMSGWKSVSPRRIDLAGKAEEVFLAQWLGSLDALQFALDGMGYKATPRWTWRDSFTYLDTHAPLSKLAPQPALHEGLKAKLTAIESRELSSSHRLVVRVFASHYKIANGTNTEPVYLLSLSGETLRPRFGLYSVPGKQPVSEDETKIFIDKLLAQASVQKLLAQNTMAQSVLILNAKRP